MNAKHGNLDISKKWVLKKSYYSGADAIDFITCENCGKLIKNIAVVENETGEIRHIGIDCAATLTNISPDAIGQAKKLINREIRFIKSLKDVKTIVIGGSIWFYKSIVTEWQHYWFLRCNQESYNKYMRYIPKDAVIINEKTEAIL